jgi:ketosteroid isomerase-like protein
MRTNSLRVNQLTAPGFDWYLNYLAILDRKDLHAYGSMLADDVVLQMNSAEPVRGKQAVLEGLGYYWPSFGSIKHDLLNIYGTDDSFVLEALNHYTRLDGEAVTLRAVAITDRNAQGLVTAVRIYTDTAPLFAAHTATADR